MNSTTRTSAPSWYASRGAAGLRALRRCLSRLTRSHRRLRQRLLGAPDGLPAPLRREYQRVLITLLQTHAARVTAALSVVEDALLRAVPTDEADRDSAADLVAGAWPRLFLPSPALSLWLLSPAYAPPLSSLLSSLFSLLSPWNSKRCTPLG